MYGRILGFSPQAGTNWVDSNTIDLPENDFGLLAAIGPLLRQFFQVSGRPGVRTDLTFVPAGHDFRGSQKPRALTRTTYFYVDPRGPLADPALRFGEIEFKPRLFFYDCGLWGTALSSNRWSRTRARCNGNTPKLLDGEVMTHACRDFGVSRKTGYKREQKTTAAYSRSRSPPGQRR